MILFWVACATSLYRTGDIDVIGGGGGGGLLILPGRWVSKILVSNAHLNATATHSPVYKPRKAIFAKTSGAYTRPHDNHVDPSNSHSHVPQLTR